MLKSKAYHRVGPDYRFDEQVSFVDIKEVFGLGHIRLGKWVENAERDKAANLIFDSLADLAFILKLPPKALGLRQTLNLAFGTGGQQGVQAHYAPQRRELALAKNAGAGALAHEFWHAFDHYIAPKAFHTTNLGTAFASHCWVNDLKPISHPLNQRLERVLEVSMLSENGADEHEFVSRAIALDKQFGSQYFSKPTELMARAFESCIESYTEISNPYLVNETLASSLFEAGGYPSIEHRQIIFKALIDYFEPLGKALAKEP
ncbi:CLCA_X family protein [Shewanella youngdeokensis]|uniref:CLCA_X family protein n=1 Tax=Shewanella youngdeokensis TaxID=2999068 RepID=A0ABZ0K487_9GAMM|nr:CLCA_X family protein [Shewanella sp. DAU334]